MRASISLTGQFAAVDEMLTGRENLILMARLNHLPRGTVITRVDELLRRFDLQDAQGRLVKTYSGGMRRRLDIAASLLAAPRVLFLDEPTTGLKRRIGADRVEITLAGGRDGESRDRRHS